MDAPPIFVCSFQAGRVCRGRVERRTPEHCSLDRGGAVACGRARAVHFSSRRRLRSLAAESSPAHSSARFNASSTLSRTKLGVRTGCSGAAYMRSGPSQISPALSRRGLRKSFSRSAQPVPTPLAVAALPSRGPPFLIAPKKMRSRFFFVALRLALADVFRRFGDRPPAVFVFVSMLLLFLFLFLL